MLTWCKLSQTHIWKRFQFTFITQQQLPQGKNAVERKPQQSDDPQ